jgi:hypothetical protein
MIVDEEGLSAIIIDKEKISVFINNEEFYWPCMCAKITGGHVDQ